MKRMLLFSWIVLFWTYSIAQEPKEKRNISDTSSGNILLQYNMDIAKGVNDEQFVSGTSDIPILKDVSVRLERFYTRFGTQEQVTAGIASKYFIKKDLYTMSGAEVQYNLLSGTVPTDRVMTRLNFGVGHEVKPNLFIELGYKPGIGTATPTVLPGPIFNSQNSFSLKAKF